MRRSEAYAEFGEPTRQSYIAILLIIWKTYRIIVRQAWPILILLVINRGGGGSNFYVIGAISAIAVIGMMYSLVNYFRYHFSLDEDELIVERGVFRRTRTAVPFDRIQTVNFEQSLLHRVSKVVRIKIDTAGSKGSEFVFDALDAAKAGRLRDLLLKFKAEVKGNTSDVVEQRDQEVEAPSFRPILRLGLVDLIKAGAAENHLKSGGLIIAFLFYIYQSFAEINLEDKIEDTVASTIGGGLLFAGILVVLFIVMSFAVSLVRMIINNYDLKLMRSDSGFKINAGLFTKKDTSALDHKIQIISYADNPLKKLLGIFDLRLKQAGSVAINKKTSIRIPSVRKTHIDQVIKSLYPVGALDGIKMNAIDKRYLWRQVLVYSALFVPIIGTMTYFGLIVQPFLVFSTWSYFLLTSYLTYRKKRFGYNTEMLVIQGGAYGDKAQVLPIYKIQAIKLNQSPYQRRHDLANLQLFTAAGKVIIPYIGVETAKEIRDTFLYHIESDQRSWM